MCVIESESPGLHEHSNQILGSRKKKNLVMGNNNKYQGERDLCLLQEASFKMLTNGCCWLSSLKSIILLYDAVDPTCGSELSLD